MRSTAAVVLGIVLGATRAFALSGDACYRASRVVVMDLFAGRYEKLGTPSSAAPADWAGWLAEEFPTNSPFKSFEVIAADRRAPGCQARIRLVTADGRVFALFIDLDERLQPTTLRSLREVLTDRAAEMDAALQQLREVLPRLKVPGVDDARMLSPMRRLRQILKESDRDVDNCIATLEEPRLEGPKSRFPAGSRRRR